ncbi:MAG: hypothetical protein ACRCU1_03460 [Alsobacter sp.]
MSTGTINGLSILRGRVTLRLVGAWDAELYISGTDTAQVTGPVVLELGGVPMVGFATAGKDDGGRVTVRVVGGAGGLSAAVGPQGYRKPTRREVLSSALAIGGETLSFLSDGTVDGLLDHWSRRAGTVAEAVRLVAEHAGAHWRVLLDGTVWVGTEAWLPVEPEHTVEDQSPTNDRVTVTVESASILPGTTFLGLQVSAVRYELGSKKLRAIVTAGSERDDLAGQLGAMVRRETAGRDLERTFVARIAAQNADGTLEITLGDSAMPGLSGVPVRLGIPGVTAYQITPGIDCTMEYENGDPSKPFVSSFASGQALSLTVSAATLVKLDAAQVEAGGQFSLVKHDILAAWVAQLTTAGIPVGLSVPPLVGAQTVVLKGG